MPDPHQPRPGDPLRVAGYRVVKRLGEGGQGTVFLGQAPGGARAAIKMLHSNVAGDSQVRQQFWCEAEIAARVATFSTARVLETGFAGERPYIVSEYVPGPSLEELVRADGPRTGSGLERLAVTTLTALASIHATGVVHRDVKPANVIMGPEGPVVIDFGIARAANTAAEESGPVGTPAYMSPEQFDARPLTPASDLFSWAGTMVFAATGRPAFAASTVPATLHAIAYAEPDLSGVPEPLRRLVAACLAKDAAARPTAGEALCDLIGNGRGLPSTRVPSRVPTDPPSRSVSPPRVPADPPRRGAEPRVHRRRRNRAAGRHAGSPAPLAPAPVSARPRRRHGLALLTGSAALAVTVGILILTSVFGTPADAQDRPSGGHPATSTCTSAPSAAPHQQAATSTTCALEPGEPD
ncbi:serine/threonine-protein kinase [Nonomuraea jiangxiensis]|uniref:Serine/threonine protein kinase n=1 Tax=Nonomuraea jiangxiensis TaxID=633440 RepID=A0A1G9IUU3_9ACTN|nr:serine/threonine-protein kinase [Nonomuraea jiangxiensis]SDL28940.1 Serine/threonine protein kinase [Nonomuraea jiangxiensis]